MRTALRRARLTALSLAALAALAALGATDAAGASLAPGGGRPYPYSPYGRPYPYGPGTAASLERVDGFGSNPGALTMYRYVPAGLAAHRPVVVALHGCTQDAPEYVEGAGWRRLADAYGFTVVAPQQESANNADGCFNWFQPGDTGRDRGEALSVRQMVDRALADQEADPRQVYVTGLSAGGAMTASLLASYPDVFAGGAVIGGVPAGCATTVAQAFTCMNPGVTKSPSEWGNLARAAYPDYNGARPRVSIWHGTADTTVTRANAAESVRQWTDVLGAGQEPDGTQPLPGGTTRSDYADAGGDVVVRSYLVEGMGHGTPVKPDKGCGTAGTYFLDTICSTRHIAEDWGLAD